MIVCTCIRACVSRSNSRGQHIPTHTPEFLHSVLDERDKTKVEWARPSMKGCSVCVWRRQSSSHHQGHSLLFSCPVIKEPVRVSQPTGRVWPVNNTNHTWVSTTPRASRAMPQYTLVYQFPCVACQCIFMLWVICPLLVSTTAWVS